MRLRNGALAESGLAWKVVVWMMSGEACGFGGGFLPTAETKACIRLT